MVATRLVTAKELEQMPDADRYELVEGELVEMAPSSGRHGRVAFHISGPMHEYLERHPLGVVYLGDVGFVLEHDPDMVLGSDLAFVRAHRVPAEGEDEGFLTVVPDLVIEIVSPSQGPTEVWRKIERYLAAGVPFAWVVEPRPRTVTTVGQDRLRRVLTEEDTLDGGEVLPGFRLPVASLFR